MQRCQAHRNSYLPSGGLHSRPGFTSNKSHIELQIDRWILLLEASGNEPHSDKPRLSGPIWLSYVVRSVPYPSCFDRVAFVKK